MSVLTYFAELALLAAVVSAILIETCRKPGRATFVVALTSLGAIAIAGFPRSGYRMSLVLVCVCAAFVPRWGKRAIMLSRIGVLVAAAAMIAREVLYSDYSLGSKLTAPRLYPVWILLCVTMKGKPWVRVGLVLIVADLSIALAASARGLSIGALAALIFFGDGTWSLAELLW